MLDSGRRKHSETLLTPSAEGWALWVGGLWQNSKRLSNTYCGAQWMGATAQPPRDWVVLIPVLALSLTSCLIWGRIMI